MMTLDEKILGEARELRDKLLDLQHEEERTRADYQHAIRRLHAKGGSLREIADELGLSHQRVHQVVGEEVVDPLLREDPRQILRKPGRIVWTRGRPFERFTKEARRIVSVAQREAKALGHNYIGTEHLLLGVLEVDDGVGARALADFGVTSEAAFGRGANAPREGPANSLHSTIEESARALAARRPQAEGQLHRQRARPAGARSGG
jgi:ATP-dependent Clp protease ATP-binding subunit ClpA